jgi:hypothetical protein
LPVVDSISRDYADRVDFVAVAWRGTAADTAARAAELMPSGNIMWGLDAEEAIFAAYGVPYQPVTVLISAGKVAVGGWAGLQDEENIRAALDMLVAS